MNISLFGETTVQVDGRVLRARDFGGVKPRQVLEILALHAPLPVTKERLADLLWDGAPGPAAIATLETYVSVLRKALQPDVRGRASVIMTVPGGYALDTSRVTVDVVEFRRLAGRARISEGEPALESADAALALAGGGLLEGETYGDWAAEARCQVEAQIVDVACRGAAAALALGWARRAELLAARATAVDPLAEGAWRLRLKALLANGRRGEALRAYDELRHLLSDRLGVSPDPATQELFHQALGTSEDVAVPLQLVPPTELVPTGRLVPCSAEELARAVAETLVQLSRNGGLPSYASAAELSVHLREPLRHLVEALPLAS